MRVLILWFLKAILPHELQLKDEFPEVSSRSKSPGKKLK